LFFASLRDRRSLHSFPTRRSSDLGGADNLSTYRAKRSPDRTPEPMGGTVTPAPVLGRLFVVHKHAARRLHFDLRLEMDGVLRSRSEEHTSELQSQSNLVCRLLLEK